MSRTNRAALAAGLLALALLLVGCGAARLRSNDDVRRIAPRAAFEAAASGRAVIYDVRPRGAFEAQHIAGAEALPENELDLLFDLLPDEPDLILY